MCITLRVCDTAQRAVLEYADRGEHKRALCGGHERERQGRGGGKGGGGCLGQLLHCFNILPLRCKHPPGPCHTTDRPVPTHHFYPNPIPTRHTFISLPRPPSLSAPQVYTSTRGEGGYAVGRGTTSFTHLLLPFFIISHSPCLYLSFFFFFNKLLSHSLPSPSLSHVFPSHVGPHQLHRPNPPSAEDPKLTPP